MRYAIVDLEATCWEDVRAPERMEIIEIGAVELLDAAAEAAREFARFVRPVLEPELSPFCRRLTTIRRRDVDAADSFPAVFAGFVARIGPGPFAPCSWGGYDLGQFRIGYARRGPDLPADFERHIDLKRGFTRLASIKPCGMTRALARAGLPARGTHRRGIDDARNIARLAALVLPRVAVQNLRGDNRLG